ncbi:MAG TPA: hypothetical protein VJ654_15505 [Noviherbaspirillum sp.]|nr:hypothetical protein [Noviherbaspirillum sp.]
MQSATAGFNIYCHVAVRYLPQEVWAIRENSQVVDIKEIINKSPLGAEIAFQE